VTDEEARKAASIGGGWVDWDHDNHQPNWTPEDEPTIKLDGEFTAKELIAILHFAPCVAENEPAGDRFEFEHAGTTHTLHGNRAAINALVQWRKRLEKITNNALVMGARKKHD
jgi:hypothetical protein